MVYKGFEISVKTAEERTLNSPAVYTAQFVIRRSGSPVYGGYIVGAIAEKQTAESLAVRSAKAWIDLQA